MLRMNLIVVGVLGPIASGKDTVADVLVDAFGFKKYKFTDPIVDALSMIFNVPASIFEDREFKEKPSDFLMGKSPRDLMKSLGNEWGRNLVDPDIWVSRLDSRIRDDIAEAMDAAGITYDDVEDTDDITLPTLKIVIPTIRYENEIKYLINLNRALKDMWEEYGLEVTARSLLIRLERPTETQDKAGIHASEKLASIQDQSHFDQLIWDLYESCKSVTPSDCSLRFSYVTIVNDTTLRFLRDRVLQDVFNHAIQHISHNEGKYLYYENAKG